MVRILKMAGCNKDTIMEVQDDLLAVLLPANDGSEAAFIEIFVTAMQKLGVTDSEQKLYEKAKSVYAEQRIVEAMLAEIEEAETQITEKSEHENKQNSSAWQAVYPDNLQIKEGQELPESYSLFQQLSPRRQAELLCHTPEDVEQAAELLQAYADSVGHRFSYFDDKMDAVKVIKREAERMFLEKEAVPIVTELKRAGANAENFYRIQPESIAPLFSYLKEDIDKFYKVFWEVERQMGVKNEFSSSFAVMKMIQDYNRKEEAAYRNPNKLEKVR